LVTCKEWEEFINSRRGIDVLASNKMASGILAVVAYSPVYSCTPPTVFIVGITLLQVSQWHSYTG